RARRDEARQKLATTAQNMVTIEAVLAELEPRLRMLRRQSRAVLDRDEAVQRLKEQLLAYYGWHWQRVNQRLQGATREESAVSTERDAQTTRLRVLEEQAEVALASERQWRSRLEMVTAAIHAGQREHDAALFAIRHNEQTVATNQNGVSGLASRLRASQSLLEEALSRQSGLEAESGAAQQASSLQEHEAAGSARVLDALRPEWARLRSAETSALQARDAATQSLANLEQQRARNQLQVEHLTSRHADSAQRLRDLRIALSAQDEELSLARPAADRATSDCEGARTALRVIEGKHDAARTRTQRHQHIVTRLESRQREYTRRGLQLDQRIEALTGELSQGMLTSLRVLPGWELAVAAALGRWSRPAANRSHAPWSRHEREKFMAWRAALPAEAGASWADEVASGAPSQLVQPLMNTLVTETAQQADAAWESLAALPGHLLASPPLQIVSRDGRVVSALGIERGTEDDGSAQYLLARSERDALDRRVSGQRSRLSSMRKSLALALSDQVATESSVQSQRIELESLDQRHAALTRKCDDLEHRREQAAEDLRRRMESEGRFKNELDSARRGAAEVEAKHAQTSSAAQGCQSAWQAASGQVAEMAKQMESAEHALTSATHALEIEAAHREAREAALVNTVEGAGRVRLEIESLQAELQQMQDEGERAKRSLQEQIIRSSELKVSLDREVLVLETVRGERPVAEERTGGLEDSRAELSQLVARHERLIAHTERLREERDRYLREIEIELGATPAALPENVEEPPTEDEVRKLRVRANQYPDAELSVVAECAELEQRYQGLRTHLEDLSSASDGLTEIMNVADHEMGSRFNLAFSAVNQEFGRIFQVMLQGGAATLEQVGEDGGIGVTAQLPGRRTRSSAAFSGGERALVATSLLFGLLRIRPTPFCLLDEVDAALDEANVDRYLAALRDISSNTQVIVVTHNRATMAAADLLYGLTMDDEGVSTMLSLHLDAYVAAG
ncbi:MAG: hypothetical protein ACRDFX_06250, partial [Chloroflexota bacterium]